jgi:glycosyltransferase involved in cell wall biosynthesis
MATFEPDPALFRRQVDSLRAQTDSDWICLISDDYSRPESFDEIAAAVAGDPRFHLSRSERRLGFYRNFERALEMVPGEAALVALCDQDDRWYPDKLEVLRGALGRAQLVYSDQRLVDAQGRVLRETMWTGRRNNHTSLASLLVANTITGAATLFRREVAELALPFPDPPGWQFHDHWIGLVALTLGEIAYVERPLYDYVQHAGAIFGDVNPGGASAKAAPVRRWRGFATRWRAAYFYGYAGRSAQAETLLARCPRPAPGKRRVLTRFVTSERSPIAFAWLATRAVRALAGRNETLGSEGQLALGILWKWLAVARGRLTRLGAARGLDASLPPLESFEQKRMRRWRARV